MKKFLVIILISIFCIIPVNAKSDIEIENIKYIKSSDGVVSNNKEQVNVIFNDLNQTVNYEAVIKNNTDQKLYVNSLETENSKEKFIEYKLDTKSENKVLEPNSSAKILFQIKTLEIEGAGRNLDEQIKVNFLVSDKITNPNTFSNIIDLIILLSVLAGTMYLVRKHKKVQTLILILGISTVGIYNVDANDYIKASLDGNIKYTSQNNIIASGTTLNGKQADYTNSKEVWAYYDKVKNVEVKSLINEPKDYYQKFDLTENKTGRVMAYLVENNDEDTPYDLKIMSKGVVIANKDSSFMFSFPNTEKVEGLTNVDFTNSESMQGMFIGNEKVEELEVSAIPLDNVKDTSYMFYDNENLDITIKDFNTDHIEIIDDITYMTQNYLYDIVKKNAKSDKDIDYVNDVTSGNYLHYPSKDNQNPIYYYRGDIKDNSVIFGNFCWYMVRTTETGGIKLLYNGKPDENGRCIEKNQNSVISETKFSYNADSLQSIGYMNGGNFPIKGQQINLETSNYVYGSSITYDENTKQYTLNDTYQINDWTTDWEKVLKKYLYTCFNETGVCNTVKRFITYPPHYNKETVSISYIDLANGKNFDETIAMSQENKNNSTAKDKTEQWYAENLLEYTRYLEDTIWCNSRKFVSGPLANEEYNNKNSYKSYIEDSHRLKIQKENIIDFSCTKHDSFTVEEDNGNGALTYPVGLLTLDELTAIGSEIKTQNRYFINNKGCMWLMTPSGISGRTGYVWRFCNPSEYNGNVSYLNTSTAQTGVTSLTFIRPSISLKSGTQFVRGTGSYDNPYIIEKIEK